MTFRQVDDEEDADLRRSVRYERLILGTFLALIAAFEVFDIFDDWYEGMALYHLLPEFFSGTVGLVAAPYLFSKALRRRQEVLSRARADVVNARREASAWQLKASTFQTGLTQAISAQLVVWELTQAEQDICFLLLKGFSLQEIADYRKTSERTVRQQASIIYKKSGLSGRVQLAAFFLEDLLASPDALGASEARAASTP